MESDNSRKSLSLKGLILENKFKLGKRPFILSYYLAKTIGEGSFGLIKQAIHLETKEWVFYVLILFAKLAIKIVEKDLLVEQEDIKRVQREIKLHSKISHPNIIYLYEVIINLKFDFEKKIEKEH